MLVALGENFFVICGFVLGYFIAMQTLYFSERFVAPGMKPMDQTGALCSGLDLLLSSFVGGGAARYWESVTYFRFGATMLYYLYVPCFPARLCPSLLDF